MNAKEIGILIDAENIGSPQLVSPIVRFAQDSGRLRALLFFGNWDSPALESWKSATFRKQTERWGAVWQGVPRIRPGKNAADIALTFEAAKLAHNHHVNEMWLVSGDSDFTPMIERLRECGIPVVVFGPVNTTPALRSACSSFVCLDDLENFRQPVAGHLHNQPSPESFPVRRIQATAQQVVERLRADKRGWFHGFIRGFGDRFGFIRVTATDELFFHANDLDNPMRMSDLQHGDPVEFKLGRNHRGVIAVHVRKTFGFSAL